jgi:hypothetical protein
MCDAVCGAVDGDGGGGTIVTVHGRGFKEGGRVWCRFGGGIGGGRCRVGRRGAMSDAGERRS